LTKFVNYQILLNEISHGFLATTKLSSGLKSLIIACNTSYSEKKNVSFLHLKSLPHFKEDLPSAVVVGMAQLPWLITTWGQCYKTFSVRNLQIFVTS
jgi:hypothetical protein